MLAAEEASGVQARLVLVPFGQQAAGSFSADEQLELANFFFDGRGDPSDVSGIMAASAARSPSVLSLKQTEKPRTYTTGGKRYLSYQYAVEKCGGQIDDAECFGDVIRRRSLATATIGSLSQYRTNTERCAPRRC